MMVVAEVELTVYPKLIVYRCEEILGEDDPRAGWRCHAEMQLMSFSKGVTDSVFIHQCENGHIAELSERYPYVVIRKAGGTLMGKLYL